MFEVSNPGSVSQPSIFYGCNKSLNLQLSLCCPTHCKGIAYAFKIDVDLGLCLDSIFTNEMQIEVGHRVKLGHSVGIKPTARLLE
jgi:hypothetical protein